MSTSTSFNPGYVYARSLTAPEQAVQDAGYQWVTTGHLRAPGSRSNYPATLRPHKHHSYNTHLIVRGQLTLQASDANHAPFPLDRPRTLRANTAGRNDKELAIIPGVCYQGRPGGTGCTFVEGHQALSPNTATRLVNNGTLMWTGGPRTRQAVHNFHASEKHRVANLPQPGRVNFY